MKISSAFPSKFLRAADIPLNQFVPVTISHVELEDVSGGEEGGGEHKPVLYFQGKNKGMVLNKTNAAAISSVYGDDTDDWAGQSIRIFQSEVLFNGQMVPCLRIRVDRNKPKPPTPAPPTQTAPAKPPTEPPFAENGGVPEEEIPF